MRTLDELRAALAAVEARLEAACQRAGRRREDVTLVAVTKRHPPALLRAAHAAGLRDFGENYAQELRDKARELSDLPGVRWHAIGPVQPKNAKYVAQAAFLFHALDSLEVAQELSRRRQAVGLPPLPVLLEVNVAGEASKAGFTPDGVEAARQAVAALPGLEPQGVMVMPPLVEDPEASRPHFRVAHELLGRLALPVLSMGTTSDFEVAVEEGATHVRVGTALFGERPG